jgi:Cys-tRNA(Pro)/Cys-tRNA(Cys) deacylase
MKLAAHLYLEQLGLPYERCTFPTTTEKGAANVARALGFHERQMVKTLSFPALSIGNPMGSGLLWTSR